MRIASFNIHHFRNITSLQGEPAPGLNLIWGENGQGKTNVLEALHLALMGRSFRTRLDGECLPWPRRHAADSSAAASGALHADPTLADAELMTQNGARRMRAIISRDGKRLFADGEWVPRLADLWGMSAVVTFTPEDAALFKNAPSPRRRWLDGVLSQTSRGYLDHLQHYHQALRQLNAVLKLQPSRRDVRAEAEAFHPALATSGAAIMEARAARLAEAAAAMRERWQALGGAGELELTYDANVHDPRHASPHASGDNQPIIALLAEKFTTTYEESRRYGALQHGPHRDDFSITLGGHDLRRYGSQGQHRLAALVLKLESARWIEAAFGEPPILMLDDFSSELDLPRRTAVLQSLGETMQVFITATHPHDLGPEQSHASSRRITAGSWD